MQAAIPLIKCALCGACMRMGDNMWNTRTLLWVSNGSPSGGYPGGSACEWYQRVAFCVLWYWWRGGCCVWVVILVGEREEVVPKKRKRNRYLLNMFKMKKSNDDDVREEQTHTFYLSWWRTRRLWISDDDTQDVRKDLVLSHRAQVYSNGLTSHINTKYLDINSILHYIIIMPVS